MDAISCGDYFIGSLHPSKRINLSIFLMKKIPEFDLFEKFEKYTILTKIEKRLIQQQYSI